MSILEESSLNAMKTTVHFHLSAAWLSILIADDSLRASYDSPADSFGLRRQDSRLAPDHPEQIQKPSIARRRFARILFNSKPRVPLIR